MSALEMLESVKFNPRDYNANEWFIEQDSFKLCSYDDKPIDIPVLIISDYTLAHYKYYISICCEKNLDDFYECLGNQPLKMIFTHLIDEDYVRRHGFNVFPDTNLNRNFSIKNNELYLDSNEVELDTENQQLVVPNSVLGGKEWEENESEDSDDSDNEEEIDEYLEEVSSDEDSQDDELVLEGLEPVSL
tara:strand:+ start:1766 stop:2332 length:567 start_codon:yes stop_codon:yes gene_type:complete